MDHCIVCNCSSSTYKQGGGVFIESGSSALMNRCVISNCTNSGVNGQGGGSALMMGGGTVRNCLFVDNHLTGGAVSGTVHIGGGVLESCTVGGNDAIRCAGVCAGGGTVRNSLIAVCTTTGSETSAEAVWAGTASCFDTCMSDVTRINGKCDQASADQIFKSVTHGNYKLCQDSAAKDKGMVLPWMLDGVDLAGNPRLRGSGPDLGCYEFWGLGLMLIVK